MRPERPSDPKRHTLSWRGGEVAYTDEGSGPCTLVALHGCPGSVRDWRWLGSHLEPHVRLIRLDLPGFGRTPLATMPDPTFPGRAEWLLEVLRRLGVRQFVPMGHSAGGPLALELAARHPERAIGLALIAAPGLTPHKPLRENPASHRISPLLHMPVVRGLLTFALRKGFEKAGFPKDVSDDSIRQSMHIIAHLDFDRQRANMEALRVPSLLAWAEDDTFIEGPISAKMAEACSPGPRLGFVEGSHYIQKTRSVEIGDALLAWLPSLGWSGR